MKPSRFNPVKARPRRAAVSVARPARGQLQSQLQDLREELATAQAELELNALRDAQAELEESHHRYADLYDFAPVGYLTLDRNGCIRTVNLTGAHLLRHPRPDLVGRPLLPLIVSADHRKFLHHLSQLRRGQPRVSTEVRLTFKRLPAIPIQLISVQGRRKGFQRTFRSVLVDLTERKRPESRILVRDAVSRILVESATLKEATPRILQALCGSGAWETGAWETGAWETGAWETGTIWELDQPGNNMCCVEFWHRPDHEFAAFEAATRQTTFTRGLGLVGRIWSTGQPLWVPDITKADYFSRAAIASQEGLRSGFCFPIKLGDEVLGVVECFTRGKRELDTDWLQMAGAIGNQLGQFIERKRGEVALHRAHAQLEQRVLDRTADLTRVNAALRDSEARLQSILDNSPAMIFLKDTRGRYLHVNRKFAEAFQSPLERTIGKTDAQIFPPKQAMEFWGNDLKVIRGGVPMIFEEIAHHVDGPHHSLVAKFPLRDEEGKIFAVGGIVTDITERQRAEEALVRSERNFANFFDSAPIGLAWLSPSGVVLRVNQAQLHMLGYSREEYLRHQFAEFHVNQTAAIELLGRLAAKETVSNFRTQVRHKNGSIRHVLIDANSLWDKRHFVHSSIFTRDISERVRLEREILEAGDRERRRIAHDLHDDLGQLLSATVYLTSNLHEDLAAKSLPEAVKIARLQKLLDDALTHTRALARGLDPVSVEPDGLVAALKALAARTRELFHVECRLLCPQSVLIVNGAVATHLYRIAQEAVTNAAKHGACKRIEIDIIKTGNQLVLTVKDDGVGISKRRGRKAGMGLGLMQYRASLVGASLAIGKQPRRGTAIVCSLHTTPVEGPSVP